MEHNPRVRCCSGTHVAAQRMGNRARRKWNGTLPICPSAVCIIRRFHPEIVPTRPCLSGAPCSPVFNRDRRVPAPISPTLVSLIKSASIPIAFEPPPTQAITASGRRPSLSRICAFVSIANRMNSRTMVGWGYGPAAVPNIVRGFVTTGPVAQHHSLQASFGGSPGHIRTGITSAPIRRAITEDVRRLALNVFGAHIDTAFQTRQGWRACRGDAVLAGAGSAIISLSPSVW